MLRARKYRFALCFRILRNQYVERSAYANIFKFNREKKRFERANVNSRRFHWFPAAMLESLRRVPTWRLNPELYFSVIPFAESLEFEISFNHETMARCLFITFLRYFNFLTEFIEW